MVLDLIGIIPKYILSAHGETTDQMQVSVPYFMEMIFAPRSGVWGHLWFVPTLFILYLVGTGYLAVSQRNQKIKVLLLILAALLSVFPIETNWLCIRDLCVHSIFFVGGIESRRLLFPVHERIFKLWILIMCLIVSVALFIIGNRIEVESFQNVLYRLIALCMTYATFYIGFERREHIGRFTRMVSKNMLSIYLYSWPFQAVMEMVINKRLHAPWPIIFICMFLIGLCGPLVLTGIYKRITNGRSNALLKVLNPILGIR